MEKIKSLEETGQEWAKSLDKKGEKEAEPLNSVKFLEAKLKKMTGF